MARDAVQAQLEALRRTQILDAAARVFATRGFHASRVQDVARDAGIANGTVYNYFPTKDALLLGLLDRLNETEARPAQLAGIGTDDPRTHIVAVLKHRLRLLADNEDLLRVLLPEIIGNPEIRARYLEAVVLPSLALGEAAIAARVGPERAACLTRAVAASTLGVLMFRLLDEPGTRADTDGIAELLADAFGPLFAGGHR